MRSFTIILLAVLLSAVGQAEDTASKDADWGSQDINLSALKTWGTKHYIYSHCNADGEVLNALGTVSLSTELTDDAVILKDKYQIQITPGEVGIASLELIQNCKMDIFLSPTRIESKGEGHEEFATFVATVAKGKAMVREQDGKQSVRDLPDGTITMASMMRLVTLVPGKPGLTYTYKYSLESEEMNLKKKYRLEVLPSETITSGGRQVPCTKFKLTSEGIRPVYYWVTKNGVLQRLIMDDRKMLELDGTPS